MTTLDFGDMELSEVIERMDQLNAPAIRKDLQEQIDPSWVRKNKVSFARIGVFNPYTLADWTTMLKKMRAGSPPMNTGEFWFLDRWLNNPVRLIRTKAKLVRDGRIKWRFSTHNSQLYLTPHAVGRFRERSGCVVDPARQCWNIPHITPGVDLNDAGNVITRQMLPTLGGAWLGYNTMMNGDGSEDYTYNRKRGLTLKQKDMNNPWDSFYALTYITENQMSWEQIDAVRAYEAGDYEVFNQLNKKLWMADPRSCFD